MARRWEQDAALRPGPPMLSLLPLEWMVTPGDDGAWWLLGGALAGDPDVAVSVEQAVGGGRDLGESVTWLLGELLAAVTGGRVLAADLTADESASLSSRLRMLLRTGGCDG